MTRARLAAMPLAVLVTALTLSASAQQFAPAPPPDSPAEGATPLVLRPTKPLELAQQRPRSELGWKLVALAALLGGAAFYLRRRLPDRQSADSGLTVVRRASIGARIELVVVNVEGQRLLLGVTPHSIQNLATLDGEEEGLAPGTPGDGAPSVGARFSALLEAAEARTPRDEAAPYVEREERTVPGQARGLMTLRRRG